MHRYKCWNGAMATTASQPSVATGTTIKTMLQIATPSTREIQIISWGFSCNGNPGAGSVIELLQTDVAATVTAHVASGVQSLDPNAPASLMTLGTSATGYTATVEGATTATRTFDTQQITAAAGSFIGWAYQFMPDERPIVAVSKFLRVRVLTPTSGVFMTCWITWDE